MLVCVVSESQQKLGGGFSFKSNITKALLNEGIKVSQTWEDADVVLIPGATMITKELFRKMKDAKKKIVLRIDNALRHTRNKGTGMSRLKEMAKGSSAVIYQSQWAKNFLMPFVGKDGQVIYNSVDETIFKPEGGTMKLPTNTYLYSRFNKDETKRWEEVWYEYQMIQRVHPKALLFLTGRFSDDLRQNNFDFFNDENYTYYGIVDNPESMAVVYRSCKYMFATYYNDAFSNTYLEWIMTKDSVDYFQSLNFSGGTREMINLFKTHGREYFELSRMAKDYIKLFESL